MAPGRRQAERMSDKFAVGSVPAGRLATESAQKPQATFHINISYFEFLVGRLTVDRLSCHYVLSDSLFARIIDVLLLQTPCSKSHDLGQLGSCQGSA